MHLRLSLLHSRTMSTNGSLEYAFSFSQVSTVIINKLVLFGSPGSLFRSVVLCETILFSLVSSKSSISTFSKHLNSLSTGLLKHSNLISVHLSKSSHFLLPSGFSSLSVSSHNINFELMGSESIGSLLHPHSMGSLVSLLKLRFLFSMRTSEFSNKSSMLSFSSSKGGFILSTSLHVSSFSFSCHLLPHNFSSLVSSKHGIFLLTVSKSLSGSQFV